MGILYTLTDLQSNFEDDFMVAALNKILGRLNDDFPPDFALDLDALPE